MSLLNECSTFDGTTNDCEASPKLWRARICVLLEGRPWERGRCEVVLHVELSCLRVGVGPRLRGRLFNDKRSFHTP